MIAQTIQPTRRRFTVQEFYRMAEAGILHEDDRVELIEGEIIEMPPIGDWHAEHVDSLTERLVDGFRDVARVRAQNPVQLDANSLPKPDLALLHRRPGFYASGPPRVADIFLLIEVTDTTFQYDSVVKAHLYAAAGVPEYWLLDRNRDVLAVHRDPMPEGYGSVQTLHRIDRVAPLAFPDRKLAVSDLLGEP